MGALLQLFPHSSVEVGPPAPVEISQPEPFFCDWLSIYQSHPVADLPLIDSGCVMACDTDGTLSWKTVRKFRFEGSHETGVNVRCDGSTVWFEGNVSRFGRTNNLFGYSLRECIIIVNDILAYLGLPPFTMGQRYLRSKFSADSAFSDRDRSKCKDIVEVWTGARVTRLDMTANYATGSKADALAYLDWLSSQQYSASVKVGTYPGGDTVDCGRGCKRVF